MSTSLPSEFRTASLAQRLAKAALPGALVAVGGMGVGCAGPLNLENGIGNAGRTWGASVYTPATLTQETIPEPEEGFEPTADQASAPVYGALGPMRREEAVPSLVSLDRDNWSATSFEVPNDFSAHQPRFATEPLNRSTNPRAQGKFPNERTALGLSTEKHSDEQFLEALVAPVQAGMDIVLMPVRIIAESRPRRPTRTGGHGYERWPKIVTIQPTPIVPEGTPGTVMPKPYIPPHPAGETVAPASGAATPSTAPRPVSPAPSPAAAPAEPPAEELKPGGGMPASDIPGGAHPDPR